MSRRKNDFFDDLVAQIFATVGDKSLTGARKATALEFVRLNLQLAHNAGLQDGLDKAADSSATVFRGQERAEAAE